MRYTKLKDHLKPYCIVQRRRTTINHAFAASIAPHDDFDNDRVREAMELLGQDPDADVLCAYCGAAAETWDHVYATVEKTKFSGHGHRLGNLLPCCKRCNSRKTNKDWRVFLKLLALPDKLHKKREKRIAAYLEKYRVIDVIPEDLPEYQELLQLRLRVLEIFQKADELAEIIRSKSRMKSKQRP